ncbi:uncharacterized protein Dvar_46530 [Desulfosarcina variabilis str. Montpellier]
MTTAFFSSFPKAKLTDDPAQCRIADIDAVRFTEDLVCALNPAVALQINPTDQLCVDVDFIASGGLRQLAALTDNGADRLIITDLGELDEH